LFEGGDLNLVDYILLGFLMSRELTGYDFKKMMEKSTANFYDASFGSIYPALARLSKKGWIQKREALEGGKLKKFYQLLPLGRETFLQWLDQPIPQGACCQELLLRVFFYKHLPPARSVFRLKEYQKSLHEEIAMLEELDTIIPPKADYFKRSTLLFGLEYYRYVIGWCDRLLQQTASPFVDAAAMRGSVKSDS
jgi:DNA-binding PadR family transcriptional regulator